MHVEDLRGPRPRRGRRFVSESSWHREAPALRSGRAGESGGRRAGTRTTTGSPRLTQEREPCRLLGQFQRPGRDCGFHPTCSPFASHKSTHEAAGQSLNLGPAAPPRPAPFIPKLKGCSEELSPRGSLLGSRPHSKSPPRRPRDTESPRPSAGALHLGGPRAPGSASLGLNPSSPRFHHGGAPLSTQAPGLETLGRGTCPRPRLGHRPPPCEREYEPR